MLTAIEKGVDTIVEIAGRVLSVLLLLMIFNVFYDVLMRYFFHNSSVGMQEMEWHLFSVVILFGISVALKSESHVRVDFIYERLSGRKRALINIFGTIFFLMPLALLIFLGSWSFVHDAYVVGEISEDPGGLTHRWVIKGMIPLSFAFLIISAVGYLCRNIRLFREMK